MRGHKNRQRKTRCVSDDKKYSFPHTETHTLEVNKRKK